MTLKTALLILALAFPGPSHAEPARPRIAGLSQIALYVHDLAKTRAFYKDSLGFDEPYYLTNSTRGR